LYGLHHADVLKIWVVNRAFRQHFVPTKQNHFVPTKQNHFDEAHEASGGAVSRER
jgi:hypothetical protein